MFSIGWVFKKLRADHLAPRLHTKPSPAVHPPFPPALRLHPSSFRCGPVLASVVTGPSPLTPTDPAASVPAAVLLLPAFISAPPSSDHSLALHVLCGLVCLPYSGRVTCEKEPGPWVSFVPTAQALAHAIVEGRKEWTNRTKGVICKGGKCNLMKMSLQTEE